MVTEDDSSKPSEQQQEQQDGVKQEASENGGAAGDDSAKKALGAKQAATLVAKLGSQRINNIFTHLRKLCQHPLLVRQHFSDEIVAEMADICTRNRLFGGNCTLPRVLQELRGYSDYQLHSFSLGHYESLGRFCLPSSCLMDSGKLVALDKLLWELQEAGSRPLIFSQWTSVLDILEWFLQERGMTYVRLDGSTAVPDRQPLVDRFNDPDQGVFVFLLSTRAGGQGLNLTGADTVILHDVDFNPQVDKQAEDRCHRLGQHRPVHVHRLVLTNTVDNNIYDIAQRKLRLDAAVLGAN